MTQMTHGNYTLPTKTVRAFKEDAEWLEQMRRKLVMSDGTNRNVSEVLRTILKNARALADDELELLDESS